MNNDKVLELAAECGIQLMPGSKYKEKLIAFAQALTEHHVGDVNDMIAAPVTPVGEEPVAIVERPLGESMHVKILNYTPLFDGTLLYTRASMPVKDGWISVDDRLPEYLEGKEFSENVIGIYIGYEDKQYTQIFHRAIVDYSEEGHTWAWARLSACYGDLRQAECEWDDDYVVTHWMPLPEPPTALSTVQDQGS